MSFPFSDPFLWLQSEIQKATAAGLSEPAAMQLATVSKEGWPAVRTVLFKGYVRDGLSFYTNYSSPKSQDLLQSGRAAVNFFWPSLQVQVRARGTVAKLTRAESEAYFKTRAHLSQIGAWASEQSREIPDFAWLEKRVAEFESKFHGQEVPCPPDWGGFHLLPLQFEFWLGRQGRLHQRYIFERADLAQSWRMFMVSP